MSAVRNRPRPQTKPPATAAGGFSALLVRASPTVGFRTVPSSPSQARRVDVSPSFRASLISTRRFRGSAKALAGCRRAFCRRLPGDGQQVRPGQAGSHEVAVVHGEGLRRRPRRVVEQVVDPALPLDVAVDDVEGVPGAQGHVEHRPGALVVQQVEQVRRGVPVGTERGPLRVLAPQAGAEVHRPEQRVVQMGGALDQRAFLATGNPQHGRTVARGLTPSRPPAVRAAGMRLPQFLLRRALFSARSPFPWLRSS